MEEKWGNRFRAYFNSTHEKTWCPNQMCGSPGERRVDLRCVLVAGRSGFASGLI